ncbi:hypothetical protein [Oscillibacter sp.]|uniref:hypothetical protein n=1 Tax=Oscillibacter sp. TaxID=1945593 RepID=UPI00289A729D|nr:hypothetical protein [Oscillibacter sp.]
MKKFLLPLGIGLVVVLLHFVVACISPVDPLLYMSDHFGFLGGFIWFFAIALLAVLIAKWIKHGNK